MNAKTIKIVYLVSKGLLSALMVFSAIMYFADHANVKLEFEKLGYPTYIICPLAIAKLLGVVAIWVKKSKTLYEWAYAGFFFDFFLAFFAHLVVADNKQIGAAIAMVLLLVSYISGKKYEATKLA